MHWYVVHTKPRQETLALQQLEQQGYNCYLPQLRVEKLRHGTVAVVQEPLFPRYLFTQLGEEASAKGWGPVRSTRGVSRLVMFGQQAARVSDSLIALLRAQESGLQVEPLQRFQPGEQVLLTKGPLAGAEGLFHTASGEQRVIVLLNILSREVAVTVPPSSLRKVN